jgi:cysteinyl-tRNA synthetase
MSTTPRTDEVYNRQFAPEKPGITWYELSKQLETELASMSIISGRWEADALRYVKNAEYWQSRAEKAESELVRLRALSDQLSDNLSAVGAAYNAEKARAEKAEAALQKIKNIMREDSNGKDPMDAVEDIITAMKEASK